MAGKSKTLSEAEMRQLETASNLVMQRKLEAKIAEKDVAIAQLTQQLYAKFLEDKRRVLAEVRQNITNSVTSYDDITKSIKSAHKVKNDWGYDPHSGEIKE